MSRPSARIYIQIRETGEVMELSDFTSVDTALNLFATSTASVSITDNLDKWYKFFYKADSQAPLPDGTGITPLLLNIHQSPRFREVNQKLASLTEQLYKLPSSNESEKAIKQNALGQIALINEYLVFDLMYRIWIDFRGREDLYDLNPPPPVGNLKERWYAGFTGIITSYDEKFSAGKLQSISLGCKDMRRFFEVTQAVTNKGYDPIWDDISSKIATMQAYTNNFSTFLDGAAVILFLADLVNRIFCPGLDENGKSKGLYGVGLLWHLPFLLQNNDLVQEANGAVQSAQAQVNALQTQSDSDSQIAAADPNNKTAQKAAADSQARLKNAQFQLSNAQNSLTAAKTDVGKASVLRNYQDAGDITPLRDVNGFAGMSKTNTFFNNAQFQPPSISGLTAKNFMKSDLVNYTKESDPTYTESRFEVDKLISSGNASGPSTNPYQILINNGVFGYENQRTPASSILASLANYMGYNIWFDAKGNIIYQTARYDDFPNAQLDGNGDYDDPVASRGIPFVSQTYDSKGKVVGYYGDKYAQDLGITGPVGLPFHGRNYIIGDESVMSWTVTQDESDAVTALSVQSNPQRINEGDIPGYLKRKYGTGQYTDPELMRKFGPRYLIAPPLISSELGGKELLDTLADGLLRRQNHNLEGLTLNLNCRPDLQLGRTIYFAERRKLYYITSIQQHYIQGGGLDTVVSGQYGHLPTDPIGDPLSVAINANIFSAASVDTSIMNAVQAQDTLNPTLDKSQ